MFATALTDLWYGFGVALEPHNVMWCFIGVFVGNMVGVLPGMGPLATISILLPLTFGIKPVGAILMLAGVFLRRAIRRRDLLDPAQSAVPSAARGHLSRRLPAHQERQGRRRARHHRLLVVRRRLLGHHRDDLPVADFGGGGA